MIEKESCPDCAPTASYAAIPPMSDRTLARVAEYFRALSDPNRLRILRALSLRQHNVGELARRLGSSQANISRHVAILVDTGIVARESRGSASYLRIADPAVDRLCEAVCGSVGRSLEEELALRAELVAARPGVEPASAQGGRR